MNRMGKHYKWYNIVTDNYNTFFILCKVYFLITMFSYKRTNIGKGWESEKSPIKRKNRGVKRWN